MNQNKKIIIEKFTALSDVRVLGLLAFGVIALLVTWSGIKVVQTNYELEKKIAITKQRNAIQQLENENLKLRNEYFESDQYLELSARRQFGKAALGEKLYVVPKSVALAKTIEPAQSTSAAEEAEVRKSKLRQNFDDWMEFLLGG